MATNNLSIETQKRLMDFFNDVVEPENFAKAIRQLNYVLALSMLMEEETVYAQKENLKRGFYWLNEMAEILNPYLE